MSLKRKFPSRMGNNRQSRRKKENKRQVKKNKKRLHQRAHMHPEKQTSKEVTEKIFDSLEKNNNFTNVSSINAEFTGRFFSGVSTWTL